MGECAMKNTVAVCSRSFSRNKTLRQELLEIYPAVKFNDDGAKLQGDDLVKFLSGHSKAIIALERLDEAVLTCLPDLKVVSKYGVGFDSLDVEALIKSRVRIGWTGGVNKRSVSELTLSLIINLLRKISLSYQSTIEGSWQQIIGSELTGKCVGIVGCGHVGKDLIKILEPFQCKILSHDKVSFAEFYYKNSVEAVGLDELLSRSDVVSIHLPYDNSTKNIISCSKIKLLKSNAIIVNVARGGLIDESCLKNALAKNHIAGAALDVFESEPPVDLELLNLPNFVVTPHIGGSSEEAVLAMGRAAIRGLTVNMDPKEFYNSVKIS